MHVAYVKPEGSAPAVKILHHTVICLARKRIWIQNPYFIPEPRGDRRASAQAVKRGVDVRVMMPSTGGSDNPMVQHAGHRNFEKLLRGGVRLFEYPHTLLHQKVMTVDGVWCAIGSSNFDDRSFETNDEITLGMLDAGIAAQLDAHLREVRAGLPRDHARRLAPARRAAPPTRSTVLFDQRIPVKADSAHAGACRPASTHNSPLNTTDPRIPSGTQRFRPLAARAARGHPRDPG